MEDEEVRHQEALTWVKTKAVTMPSLITVGVETHIWDGAKLTEMISLA